MYKSKPANVLIKNPTSEFHLVRLLPEQNLELRLSGANRHLSIVDVRSDYLDEIGKSLVDNTLTTVFAAKPPENENSLYLGQIVLAQPGLCCTNSLCVVQKNDGQSVKIIEPDGETCPLTHGQMLEVAFLSTGWCCTVLNYRSHFWRIKPVNSSDHLFSFILEPAMENFTSYPSGNFEVGKISFHSTFNETRFVNVVLKWKLKSPSKQVTERREFAKLVPLAYDDFETGCRVVLPQRAGK